MKRRLSRTEFELSHLGGRKGKRANPPPAVKVTDIQGKKWCVRLTKSKVESLVQLLDLMSRFQKFVFQLECGEGGVEHYQGYFETDGRSRRRKLRKLFKDQFGDLNFPSQDYLEKANNEVSAASYCAKATTRIGGPWTKGVKRPVVVIDPKTLYKWQREIYDLAASYGEPCATRRKIYWFWENRGNMGKSYLSKCMVQNLKRLVVRGSTRDITFGFKAVEEKRDVDSVIIDIPRNRSVDNISYDAIEDLLNGVIFNTKYESGEHVFNPPIVIVFANNEPDMSKLSNDRWVVKKLN